jgi:hypothetical protein
MRNYLMTIALWNTTSDVEMSIVASLSKDKEGDAGWKKDGAAAKKRRTKAHWRDKLVLMDSKIGQKRPKANQSIGTEEVLGATSGGE